MENFDKVFSQLVPWLVFLGIIFCVWISIDSTKRYAKKWILPLVCFGIAFGPYFISVLIGKENSYLQLLFLVSWIFYLIVRPELTIEEEKMLEIESRIRDLTKKYYEYELSKSSFVCPVCGLPIEKEYRICPNCFTRLRNTCSHCKKLIDVQWTTCPFCENKVTTQDLQHAE